MALSPTTRALFDGVADAKGSQYALGLADVAGKTALEIIKELTAEHGGDSLYVMQVVGEVIVDTVNDTIGKLIAARKH